MEKLIIDKEHKNLRLDVYVTGMVEGHTRSFILQLIKSGNILVNGNKEKAGYKLRIDDEVVIDMPPLSPMIAKAENIALDIVYEDDDLAVINKPQGMVVHPAVKNREHTLVNALLYNLKNLSGINGVIRPGIVHRIDKDTAGLLVVAKNDKAHLSLSSQIQSKQCKRFYYALVDGIVKEDGIIENYIGRDPRNRLKMAVTDNSNGKEAKSIYKVLKIYDTMFGKYSLLEFELKTGRTHQIRVHCAYINHAIVGDRLYNKNKDKFKLNGQLLFAKRIEFFQPTSLKHLFFEIELPDYFKNVLDKLDKNNKF